MDPMTTLLANAEAAGRQDVSWNEWTASDETQDLINACERPDVDACEAAFAKGAREHRLTSGWRVFWTTAPEAYDSFGTETVEACGDYCGKPLRKVLIHPHYINWQTGRYGSGLHPAWEGDPRVADAKAKADREEADRRRAEHEAKRAAGLVWLTIATEDELSDFDTLEARGLRYADVSNERFRRESVKTAQDRAAEWARCLALVTEGATLIDDGEPPQRGQWGTIPGRDSHVYYNVQIVHGWPDDADHANVVGEGGANVGSVAYVADWIKSGRLRVATVADAVPPRAVLERIGHEQRKEIRRVEVGGRVVWVGRPRFGAERLVLDEKGHLVRAKKVVQTALASE